MNWDTIQAKVDAIEDKITYYESKQLRMFTTSSFQTHSIVLLHILSKTDKNIPVYFLDTGYHFPETIAFKEEITEMLDLNVIGLKSFVPKDLQRDGAGNLLFTTDPDYCCLLNKIQPLEPILMSMDVWINGVRSDQNENRKRFKEEEKSTFNTLRYHPLLQWSSREIFQYRKEYKLPVHPLEAKGYLSIGCEPCTRKYISEDGRDSRWFGMNKTECGLNTELIVTEDEIEVPVVSTELITNE